MVLVVRVCKSFAGSFLPGACQPLRPNRVTPHGSGGAEEAFGQRLMTMTLRVQHPERHSVSPRPESPFGNVAKDYGEAAPGRVADRLRTGLEAIATYRTEKFSALKRTSSLCLLCDINRGESCEEDLLPSRSKRRKMCHFIQDLPILRRRELRHYSLSNPVFLQTL